MALYMELWTMILCQKIFIKKKEEKMDLGL